MAEMPMLLIAEGPKAGQRIVIEQQPLVIGRDETCDLVIPDRQVSRQHARIKPEADRYLLEDLDSKNGTFVNGQELLGSYPLQDGDEIQIALCCRLVYVDAEATVPLILEQHPEGLRLDLESKRVWVGGQELEPPLSLAQYRLLELLHQEPDRVYSRDEIVAAVWPEDERDGISEQAIDALARRLRERLAELDSDSQYIITVRGHGFRLNAERLAKG
ncbi:MAG: FHA domain-containing protein [Anaerolineae bacterium]|nr:FHA domain-containing protein [Anaerolineae bacterium]